MSQSNSFFFYILDFQLSFSKFMFGWSRVYTSRAEEGGHIRAAVKKVVRIPVRTHRSDAPTVLED